MIPTLKQAHEKRLKKRLFELKTNPELLQEYYSQKQLEEMGRTLRKLGDILKKPEFKGMPSFLLAIRKAWAELDDHLSMSKARRAISLGLELKRITTLITGLSNLFKQLPFVIEPALEKLPYEWSSDQPIVSIFREESIAMPNEIGTRETRIKKLRTHILKAMKPGFFGVKDIPYINSDEAVTEVMGLSLNQIKQLEKLINNSHILRQTLGDQKFMSRLTGPNKPTVEPVTKQTDKIKIKLPTNDVSAEEIEQMTPQEFAKIFNATFKETMKLANVDEDIIETLRVSMLKTIGGELMKKGVIKKVSS